MEEGILLFSPFTRTRKRRFARVIFPPQNFWAREHFILSPSCTSQDSSFAKSVSFYPGRLPGGELSRCATTRLFVQIPSMYTPEVSGYPDSPLHIGRAE